MAPAQRDSSDSVDAVIAQWARERPEMDLSDVGVYARLIQLSDAWGQVVEDIFERHGLTGGEFDVLAALRRSGRPYTLTPSALAGTLMMSRAGMTGRLDRLEERGLIVRTLDADDRRSFRISLTARGRKTIDAAVDDHTAVLDPLQTPLTRAERDILDQNLRRLLRAVDEIRSGHHS